MTGVERHKSARSRFAFPSIGTTNTALACWALLLFLIATARDAFLNLNYHWTMLPLPKGLIVGHARVAVVGFVLRQLATEQTAPWRTDRLCA